MSKFFIIFVPTIIFHMITAQPTDSSTDNIVVNRVSEIFNLISFNGLPIIDDSDKNRKSLREKKLSAIISMILYNNMYFLDTQNLHKDCMDRLTVILDLTKKYASAKKKIASSSKKSPPQMYDFSYVDYVLRYHRPFTVDEKNNLANEEKIKIKQQMSNSLDAESYDEDIDHNHHNAKEREFYRSRIEKYHLIDSNFIKTLLEMRYQLLKKKLKESIRPEVMIEMKKRFFEDRLYAQVDYWKRNDKIMSMDSSHDPFALLKNDHEYRKYMNFHEDYFKGNLIYGYKNRYDRPADHGLSFEVTAENVIGRRYNALRNLYDEMRNFVINGHRTGYQIEDLPMIDYLLGSFKILTFEFPQSRFKAKQWSRVSKGDFGPFMIIPRHFESKNSDEIQRRIDDDIHAAKTKVTRDMTIDFKFNKKNFQKSLFYQNDRSYVVGFGIASGINFMNEESKEMRFKLALEAIEKLLPTFKETYMEFNEQLSEFGKTIEKNNDNTAKNFPNTAENKNNEKQAEKMNEMINDIKDTFDPKSNNLVINKVIPDSNKIDYSNDVNYKRKYGSGGDGSSSFFEKSYHPQLDAGHSNKKPKHH